MPSTHRLGLRTTQTVNPQDTLPDIDEILRRADPTLSQLETILDHLPGGKPPKAKRIDVRQYMSFDPLDRVTNVVVGTAANNEQRFARLEVQQRSLLATTAVNMIYQPGDKLVLDNGQVVEVVATPVGQLTGLPQLSAALTGTTAGGNPPPGWVIVRVVQPVAFNPNWTGGWIQFLGHTIYEGEPVQSKPWQRDVIYDYNYVEHIERVMECTEDETEFITLRGSAKDMQFQREETLHEIKQDVELLYMFGKRSFDMTIPDQPKLHMGGVLDFITTNVMVYNPNNPNLNFEQLVRTWMTNCLFRVCPNGMRKTVFVGERLSDAFMQVFDNLRRIQADKQAVKNVGGVSVTTYEFNGRIIDLVTYRHFRVETPWSWWAVGLNIPSLETRIKKKYQIRDATLPNERVYRYAVEWQGSLAVHLRDSHALLRTP
jgi:hypothetical protein